MSRQLFQMAADAVLIIHFSFVAFVLLGLILIIIGGSCGWRWVRNPWLRVLHLAAIGIVVAESWLGWECPLTTWEEHLREQAGDETYAGAFIAHWLQSILFYEAPPWAFTLGYTMFGLAVIASWIFIRPRPFRKKA